MSLRSPETYSGAFGLMATCPSRKAFPFASPFFTAPFVLFAVPLGLPLAMRLVAEWMGPSVTPLEQVIMSRLDTQEKSA